MPLATVAMQKSRYFGGFVKGSPKLSFWPFLHRPLHLVTISFPSSETHKDVELS